MPQTRDQHIQGFRQNVAIDLSSRNSGVSYRRRGAPRARPGGVRQIGYLLQRGFDPVEDFVF